MTPVNSGIGSVNAMLGRTDGMSAGEKIGERISVLEKAKHELTRRVGLVNNEISALVKLHDLLGAARNLDVAEVKDIFHTL